METKQTEKKEEKKWWEGEEQKQNMVFTSTGLVSGNGLGGMQMFFFSLYSTVEQVNFLSLSDVSHPELSQIATLAIGFS